MKTAFQGERKKLLLLPSSGLNTKTPTPIMFQHHFIWL